jgi:hypothetical protein
MHYPSGSHHNGQGTKDSTQKKLARLQDAMTKANAFLDSGALFTAKMLFR